MLIKLPKWPDALRSDHIETIKKIRAAITSYPKKRLGKQKAKDYDPFNFNLASHSELLKQRLWPLGF